jgi:hypothetical protein
VHDATDIELTIAVKRKPREVDVLIGELAERQYGRVARWQLVRRGVTRNEIGGRMGRLLHPVHRGVYAVGHRAPSREARWMAAVLAGGLGAALSSRAAGALLGIRNAPDGRIDVTVPRQRRPRAGITFHHVVLPSDEITVVHGIPATTVTRTLFDLAALLRPRQLERALNEAEVLRLLDDLSLHELLRRYPRHRGSRAVRAMLDLRDRGRTVTRSELEVGFLEFLDDIGLPQPQTNVRLEGIEVDCAWNEQRLVVELDGRSFHETQAAFDRDRERDRTLQASGWRVARVTARQLQLGRRRLATDLRRLLGPATLAP